MATQASRNQAAASAKARSAPPKPDIKTQVHSMPAKAGPKTGTQVQTRQTTALVASNVPDHIKQGVVRGSENVEMGDVVIPRIELVQALSPCISKGDAAFIEGAEVGMLFNSVTRRLYGEHVTVCPVLFRKQWLVWKDRKKGGGGFGGAFDTVEAAQARIEEEPENEQELWDKHETAQQIVLVVDQDTGDTDEAVVSMARTKLKISRQWNSLIRIAGFDRFSRIYDLFGVDDANANGDKYKNLGVAMIGFAPKAVYDQAEALYESISAGIRKVAVDHNYDEEAIEGEGTPVADKEY